MSFDPSQSAGYLVNQLARLFARELNKSVQPLGLAPAQFLALTRLCSGPPMTQRDLARAVNVDQATMAGTLSRMERDGLIRRVANPSDGRSQLIAPTDKATAAYHQATSQALAINDRALSALSPDDRDRFLSHLRTLIATLDTDAEAPE